MGSQTLYKGVQKAISHKSRCPEEEGSGNLVSVQWGGYGGCAPGKMVEERESELESSDRGVHCIHEDLLTCTQGTFVGQVVVGSGVRKEDAGVSVWGGG